MAPPKIFTAKEIREHKNIYQKKWRKLNRDKTSAYNKRATDRRRRWFAENHDWAVSYNRDYHCRKKYGVSYEEKMRMLTAQGGVCAICKTSVPGTKHEWVVDHDHKTKAIREILCHMCNLVLGTARDDADILQAAANYLRQHSPPPL